MAEKKRNSIKQHQAAVKKETEALRKIELEINVLQGEQVQSDINKLRLSPEEFQNFRKVVLGNKDNLMDEIQLMSDQSEQSEKNTVRQDD